MSNSSQRVALNRPSAHHWERAPDVGGVTCVSWNVRALHRSRCAAAGARGAGRAQPSVPSALRTGRSALASRHRPHCHTHRHDTSCCLRARLRMGSCCLRARLRTGSCCLRARLGLGSCCPRARLGRGSCCLRARLGGRGGDGVTHTQTAPRLHRHHRSRRRSRRRSRSSHRRSHRRRHRGQRRSCRRRRCRAPSRGSTLPPPAPGRRRPGGSRRSSCSSSTPQPGR